MSFSADQVERYARHLVLSEIGGAGQQKLANSKVLLIGAGGLGAPAALYLAAAGFGAIGLVDDDVVSLSNLQRQILFATRDIGQAKVQIAANRLQGLNPDIKIIPHNLRITNENAKELIRPFDLVLDGSDNFPTRFLVNQTCHELGKTLICGAVGQFDGQVSVHNSNPKNLQPSACYQCLVPAEPPNAQSCEQVGIVGALTGIIGSIMALEAIKLVANAGESLCNRLLIWDGLSLSSRTVKLHKDPACKICGNG